MGDLLIIAFAAAQGLVVLATAAVALHLLKKSGVLAKFIAMTVSYVAWVAFTIVGYGMLGGEGGLMDGFGLVLFLCFTALVSSFIYWVAWAIFGLRHGATE